MFTILNIVAWKLVAYLLLAAGAGYIIGHWPIYNDDEES